MKLSDVKGERSMDVIADIIDPIYKIAEDKKCAELFTRKKLPEGETAEQFGAEWLMKAAKLLLKNHKKDCIAIMAAIEGTTPKKYADSLDLMKLLMDIADLMSDDTFMSLFFSTTQSTGNSSGSTSENITAEKT